MRVDSEKAVRVRRGVMQLLLARSPESAELKELAARMGVTGTPYPTVTESQRNCVLCGLCVAACEEAIGASAIGFAGRGVERLVAAPFRAPSEACIACGACAAVCPVGTIQVRIHEDSGEAEISPFKSRVQAAGLRVLRGPHGQRAGGGADAEKSADQDGLGRVPETFPALSRVPPQACGRRPGAGAG